MEPILASCRHAARPYLTLLLLLIPSLAVGASAAPGVMDDDAGTGGDAPDGPDPSFTVAPETTHHGHVDSVTDPYDYYAIHGAPGTDVEVRVTGFPLCLAGIEDSSGTDIDACAFTVGTAIRYQATIPADGIVHLRMESLGAQPYAFTYVLGAGAPDPVANLEQDDAGTGGDAPDEPDPSFTVAPETTHNGYVDLLSDPYDYYAIHGAPGARVDVLAAGHAPLCLADIQDSNGTNIDDCSNAVATGTRYQATIPADGLVYLRMRSLGAQPYAFTYAVNKDAPDPVTGRAISQDDAGTGGDAPDQPDPSFTVAPETTHNGYVDILSDPYDYYAIYGTPGERVDVVALGHVLCFADIQDSSGTNIDDCITPNTPGTRYQATIPADGLVYLRMRSLGAQPYNFTYAVGKDAPDPTGAPPPPETPEVDLTDGPPHPEPGTATACPGAPAAENDATHGAGDAHVPSLVWAALKTGFRAVVVFETEEPVAGSLTYDLDGGTAATLTDTTPRTQHVFVLDDLPVGSLLCFRVAHGNTTSESHALRLENAMNAHDGAAYTINLLVLAHEQVAQRSIVSDGMDVYARKLWDATDGNVRSGRTIILYSEPERHNSGWASCTMVHSTARVGLPTCNRVVDVLFTNDAFAAGAASTYLDGIQHPDMAIWMNWYWQGTGLDDTGAVLLHEVGHYAFGAMDLYGGTLDEEDCYDPATGISIMGGDRDATEFDGPDAPCPNAASITGYVPSWTLLRQRFPAVPERTGGPVAGPSGDGGDHHVHEYALAPDAALLAPEQDDAGTGRDAPNEPDPTFTVAAETPHRGFVAFVADPLDFYAIHGAPGQRVDVLVSGHALCSASIQDSSGTNIGSCGLAVATGIRYQATIPADGVVHLRIGPLGAQPYVFTYAVDKDAPDPLLGAALSQDDAGTGDDAPDEPDPAFTVAAETPHQGRVDTLTDPYDFYAIHGLAGQRVEVVAIGHVLCSADIQDSSGTNIDRCNVLGVPGTRYEAIIPADGLVYLRMRALGAEPYNFTYAVGKAAPDVLTGGAASQDDAGTGGDAPDVPDRNFTVAAETPHRGYVDTVRDAYDHYAIHGAPGDTVDVRALGHTLCLADIQDSDGVSIDACSLPETPGLGMRYQATIPADGLVYLRMRSLGAQPYVFTYAVGKDAPEPALVG